MWLTPIQVRTTIVINMPKNRYHIQAYTEVTSIWRPCPNASKIGQTYSSSDDRGFPGVTSANTSCTADANKDAWVITVVYLLRKIEPIELSVRMYLMPDKLPTGAEAVQVTWKMQAWGMTNSLASLCLCNELARQMKPVCIVFPCILKPVWNLYVLYSNLYGTWKYCLVLYYLVWHLIFV